MAKISKLPTAKLKARQAKFRYARAQGRHRYCVYSMVGHVWRFIGTIWYAGGLGWKGQTRVGREGWDAEHATKVGISEILKDKFNEIMKGMTDGKKK